MSTFKLPDLGEGLAEAEVLQWHVKLGDRAVVDQPMVSVETAKAVVEVPVPFTGTVTALHAAVGDIVATGARLIDLDSSAEAASPERGTDLETGTVVGALPATSAEEFVESPDRGPSAPADSRARAVPVARALAKRLGLALSDIDGSGPDGLITLDDVVLNGRLGAARSAALARSQAAAPVVLPVDSAEPLRGPRRSMAHSMSMSRDQVAGSTVCDDADIHSWSRRGEYMPRLIRAMIAACAAEPALNAWYDSTSNSRALLKHIDLAIAVDTPGGLIVPVLRDVGAKSPEQLRAAIAAHKDAAHGRGASPQDLRDFTLMLSNFGTLAGRYGVPLIVPPAVAILGAGKVRDDAVVVAGAVVAHRRMPLSLSFDHRCITGGEACRFLAALIADIEKPD